MLYTRKGDGGTTKVLYCDQRLSKSSAIAEALGAVDELNSLLGFCKTQCQGESLPKQGLVQFSINYLLKGNIDAYIPARGFIWDFAPLAILTEEAGGKFSDFSGKFSLTSDNAIFSNGLIHDKLVKILSE